MCVVEHVAVCVAVCVAHSNTHALTYLARLRPRERERERERKREKEGETEREWESQTDSKRARETAKEWGSESYSKRVGENKCTLKSMREWRQTHLPFGGWACACEQRAATHCNTLQHTATHCNALQHTATRCVVDVLCACACSEWETGAEVSRSFTCGGGGRGVSMISPEYIYTDSQEKNHDQIKDMQWADVGVVVLEGE